MNLTHPARVSACCQHAEQLGGPSRSAPLGVEAILRQDPRAYTGLTKILSAPSALVALNPDVHRRLDADFHPIRTACSRVPGLMTSLHTSSVDEILRYVGGAEHGVEAHNLIGGCLLQQLRLLNTYSDEPTLSATSGIVIFGMITKRHGTSEDNVANLCTALDRARLPATFRVVIVGKAQEDKLEKRLRSLVLTAPRLVFHGQIGSFNDLVSTWVSRAAPRVWEAWELSSLACVAGFFILLCW